MAQKYNHHIVERWKAPDSPERLHLTSTGAILRTTGPKLGKAKIVREAGAWVKLISTTAKEAWRNDLRALGWQQEVIEISR